MVESDTSVRKISSEVEHEMVNFEEIGSNPIFFCKTTLLNALCDILITT